MSMTANVDDHLYFFKKMEEKSRVACVSWGKGKAAFSWKLDLLDARSPVGGSRSNECYQSRARE